MLNIFGLRSRANTRQTPGASISSGLLAAELFQKLLRLEHRRIERSRRCFILMLVEPETPVPAGNRTDSKLFADLARVLAAATRETDVTGWYQDGRIAGVIFTEIPAAESQRVACVVQTKIRTGLTCALGEEQASQIAVSCYVFPNPTEGSSPGEASGTLDRMQQLQMRAESRRTSAFVVKRTIDILGGLAAIVLFSPLMIAIALLVKLTSNGPLLFRQQRVGQVGRQFTFLKFRSMYSQNNHAAHQEYIKEFIAGNAACNRGNAETAQAATATNAAPGAPVFKLMNDPRITPIGRFLRKTSLDELPQFFNVLSGEMSLVGPRPPIPYEVEYYDVWHRRRFLDVKPGITGLWQVHGRSRTTFDEMVRLDIRYENSWSLWLDIKILLQTPRAVVTGDGAH